MVSISMTSFNVILFQCRFSSTQSSVFAAAPASSTAGRRHVASFFGGQSEDLGSSWFALLGQDRLVWTPAGDVEGVALNAQEHACFERSLPSKSWIEVIWKCDMCVLRKNTSWVVWPSTIYKIYKNQNSYIYILPPPKKMGGIKNCETFEVLIFRKYVFCYF